MYLLVLQNFRRTIRNTIIKLNVNQEYFTRKIVHVKRLLWYDPSRAKFSNTIILKLTPRPSLSLSSTFQKAKFRFKDIVKTGSFEEPPNPVLHGLNQNSACGLHHKHEHNRCSHSLSFEKIMMLVGDNDAINPSEGVLQIRGALRKLAGAAFSPAWGAGIDRAVVGCFEAAF